MLDGVNKNGNVLKEKLWEIKVKKIKIRKINKNSQNKSKYPRSILMNIYIGNFSYDVTGDDLIEAFSVYGHVASAKVIRDKFTGGSKGFGFVEMPNTTEAQAALIGVTQIQGKKITINEARPLENRRSEGPQNSSQRRKGNAWNKTPRGARRY